MMLLAAPKGLFPPEPECYKGPKLKVAIIGAGLAGMSTAVELLDQGHEVFSFNLSVCWIDFLNCRLLYPVAQVSAHLTSPPLFINCTLVNVLYIKICSNLATDLCFHSQ